MPFDEGTKKLVIENWSDHFHRLFLSTIFVDYFCLLFSSTIFVYYFRRLFSSTIFVDYFRRLFSSTIFVDYYRRLFSSISTYNSSTTKFALIRQCFSYILWANWFILSKLAIVFVKIFNILCNGNN
jgi:hypothetical protein